MGTFDLFDTSPLSLRHDIFRVLHAYLSTHISKFFLALSYPSAPPCFSHHNYKLYQHSPKQSLRLNVHLIFCPLHTPFNMPSRCASRFNESSPSPIARTKPHRAYTWFSPVYRPFSSTLPTEICTEAWSLALMMRLVAEHLRGT